MNPEFPTDPRQALEASLTALLLGELPDDQARFLRQAIATDQELARTFERLKKTVQLVRETEASPVTAPSALPVEPKLSDARRQQLLQRFKTVRPAEFKAPARRKVSWLVPAVAAGGLMLLVATAVLTTLSRSKSKSPQASSSFAKLDLPGNNIESAKLASSASLTLPRGQTLRSFDDANASNERDKLALQQRPSALPSSRPVGPAVGKAQTAIVLPSENKPVQDAIPASTTELHYTEPQQLAGDGNPVSRTSASPSETFSFDAEHGGLGGGGVAGTPTQERIPVLGDVPLLGKIYRNEFQKEDSSSLGQRGDEINREIKPDTTKPQEAQQAAGSYNFGGAFGRYSAIQPQSLEGQEVKDVVHTKPELAANDVRQGLNGEIAPAKGAFRLADADKKAPTDTLAQSIREAEETTSGKRDRALEPVVEAKIEEKAKTEVGQEPAPALDEMKQLKEEARKSVAKNEVASPARQTADAKKQSPERLAQLKAGVQKQSVIQDDDVAQPKPTAPPPTPQPEVQTRNNAFSTFSLNVSDVSFKLAAASLEKGVLPEAASIRSEEFINAFDYRDAAPAAGQPVAFAWERARYPFAQNRDALRFSIKTAASGRQAAQPLNIVLLLDNSGSMERADRVLILQEALRVLASQLQAQDTLSVVTFARTPRLWVDGAPGNQAGRVAADLSSLTPQGGTNLEEAMNLAYQTALRHYIANGINHVVLLTDGAANLGDTNPEVLKKKVETNRKQGIALDCFGIGWEGYNDDLLEVLTRNGDGRYGFLNTPEEAAHEFAGPLAGALHVAASDVKVQVEFNPNRVTSYRQVGYARHQLTKEQFRDNTVDAAELGATESGNALYVIEADPQGAGPLANVRVRYKLPGTAEYREQEWTVPFTGNPASLEQAGPAMRLTTTAGAFSEWLTSSAYATEVTLDRLLSYLNGVPQVYGADPRPQKLEWMIRQAKAISGK